MIGKAPSTKRALSIFLLVSLAVFFWLISFYQLDILKQYRTVSFREIPPLTPRESQNMRAEEELPFASWRQLDGQSVSTPVTLRQSQTSILEIDGQARLVLEGSGALTPEDTTGCLIDTKTSENLFGNTHAVGATVLYQDKEYTVRGVFSGPKNTMMIVAEKESPLDNLSVQLDQKTASDTFAMRHGLSPTLTVSPSLFYHVGVWAVLLPIFLLFIFILIIFRRGIRYYRYRLTPKLLCSVGFWLTATVFVGAIISAVPVSVLPAKWSNFEHWSRVLARGKDFIFSYLSLPKLRPDILQLSYLIRTFPAFLSLPLLGIAWGLAHSKENLPALQTEKVEQSVA